MHGDPTFPQIVLDALGDFVERHGFDVAVSRPGWLELRSDHCELLFIHDRQADCVIRPAGDPNWGALTHVGPWRGMHVSELVDPKTRVLRGGMAAQVRNAAAAIEHHLGDLLDGRARWWADYQADANEESRLRRFIMTHSRPGDPVWRAMHSPSMREAAIEHERTHRCDDRCPGWGSKEA